MIAIRDNIGTLTAEQRQALTDKALAYPFDIYVTIGATGSKGAFQAEVSSLVTKAKVVSIGVDPAHRFTFVRGSKDLGLPDGPELAAAGNAHFKRADIVGGIDSIAAKARELKVSSRIVESATGSPIVVQEKPMASGWWWALGGLGAIVLGVSVGVWLSKRREAAAHRAMMAELNNELGDAKLANAERSAVVPDLNEFDRRLAAAAERKPRRPSYSGQRVDDAPEPAAIYLGGSYQPPVVVQQSNNDLLTGMLLADALSHNHHHTHTTVTERVVERTSGDSGSSSSWGSDSSGSSSSWSDSSSSSSWDSGSSSSYDSGGSDWGGGGGGSDW